VFVSFNETTWWVFDKETITGVCVPIRCGGKIEIYEEESKTCFASGGCYCGGKRPPATTCRWLADRVAPPVVREKSAAAVEFM